MLFRRACPYHGPTLQKICSWVTHQLQDETWEVEMYRCMDCTPIVRLYCLCTPGLMYCTDCYGNHHADVEGDEKGST